MSFDDDIDDRRRRIAVFREEILDELDGLELVRGELTARVAELEKKKWQPPSGQERGFTARTIWSWWSAYKHGGLVALVPQSRKTGPREVTPDILAAAIKARGEVPSRSTRTLIDVLEKQQLVPRGKLRRSTLDRHLEADRQVPDDEVVDAAGELDAYRVNAHAAAVIRKGLEYSFPS